MAWLKENRLIILMDYINLIFILRLMIACYKIQRFDYWLITLLFIVTSGVYWLYHELLSGRRPRWIITSVLFVWAAAGIYYKREQIIYFLNDSIVKNFNSINDAIYNSRFTEFYQFKPFIFILLPLIIFIIMAMNSRGSSNGILFFTVSILIFFWYLEFLEEVKARLLAFVIISTITYSINVYQKYLKQLSKQGIQIELDRKRIIAYIAACSIIVAWVGLFLPQQYEGNFKITGDGLWRNPFGPEVGGASLRLQQGRFGLNTVGYNDTERKLGGPIELTDELVFKVDSDKPYYLKGDVLEFYTGSSWKKEIQEYEKISNVSGLEVNSFISSILGSNRDKSKKFMSIYPEEIITNTIFVPSFVQEVTTEKGSIYYEKNASTFLSSEKNIKEFIIGFYDPDDVINAVRRRASYRGNSISRADFEKYLQVPDNITERTVELVYNLVKDSRTDEEKLEKIKTYLSVNYPYSLNVSEVPEDVDFIDYFLFTEKKGYCVYFASAMTMMARIAGIPARYVEGFKMPNTSFEGIYQVTAEQAHAWTEVLIRQDPEIWMTVDCSTTPAEERQRLQQEVGMEFDLEDPITEEDDINIPEEQTKLDGDMVSGGNTVSQVSKKVILSIGLIFALIFIILIRLIVYKSKKNRMLNSKSIIPLYSHMLKRIKRIGINKSDYSTDAEFASDIYDGDLKIRVKEIVEIVYEEFYGGMLKEDYNKSDFYEFLEQYIRKRQNIFKYYLAKFFM